MKRLSVLVAAVFASSMLLIATPQPANAIVCHEQPDGSCDCGGKVNDVWEKITGGPLIYC
ncbi:MAG TPA: hypothetical protein VJ927_10860 [Actinomycetota bacterium]|nr:hypothetical protein [Actinomycetota bacterium]